MISKLGLFLLIDLIFLIVTNLPSGETLIAPKEQLPRKLSGKRTDKGITLWKEMNSAEGVKLSGKDTDGVRIKVLCRKNI